MADKTHLPPGWDAGMVAESIPPILVRKHPLTTRATKARRAARPRHPFAQTPTFLVQKTDPRNTKVVQWVGIRRAAIGDASIRGTPAVTGGPPMAAATSRAMARGATVGTHPGAQATAAGAKRGQAAAPPAPTRGTPATTTSTAWTRALTGPAAVRRARLRRMLAARRSSSKPRS